MLLDCKIEIKSLLVFLFCENINEWYHLSKVGYPEILLATVDGSMSTQQQIEMGWEHPGMRAYYLELGGINRALHGGNMACVPNQI